jgi:hypothetical protein
MFSITLSHFERITEIFAYDNAIIIFGENIFIFSFVIIDRRQSQLGWVHIREGGRENKMSKDECEYFYNQIRMNHLHLVDRGQSLQATMLYNDSQHNIPAFQGRVNKWVLLVLQLG